MATKERVSETEDQEQQEGIEQERARAAFEQLVSESEGPVEQERVIGEKAPEITAEQLTRLIASRPELAEALADAEPVKRRIQSEADKRLDRFRRDMEAQKAQEAARQQQTEEQERVAALDDEDFGRHVREQQNKQQSTSEQVTATLAAEYRRIGEMLLEAIPDPQERQRVNEGTYASWDEFRSACLSAAVETSAKQRLAKREKVQSESATKGETAEEVETAAAIITGVGAPSGSRASFKRLSNDEQWRVALQRAFAKP